MSIEVRHSYKTQPDHSTAYRNCLRELNSLAQRHRLPVIAFNQPDFSYFDALSPAVQTQILGSARAYLNIGLQAESEGADLDDCSDPTHLWASLKTLGLHLRDDVFTDMRSNDIVEVYNQDSLQIFRSWNLFRYLSYSLDEIFCHEWWQLYDRDVTALQASVETSKQILSGKQKGVFKPSIPNHEVREIFSHARLTASIEHRYAAPVYNKDQNIAGFISIFRIVGLRGALPL